MVHQVRRFAMAALLAAGIVATGSAPAGAIVYHGEPDLPLTVSLVVAGGGPAHFSAVTAVKALCGPQFDAEADKLTAQFGKAEVEKSFEIFTFAVNDTLAAVTRASIPLPKPAPPPNDAAALRAALYAAGTTPDGHWDVGYFLEHLITHPIHHAIMRDMNRRFGRVANANFHIVLAQLMHDASRLQ